jgi:hypothetical protein
MKQLRRLSIVLFCLASLPAFAGGPCLLSSSGAISQAALNYDPFQAGAATATITFSIQNRGDACTAAFAFFKAGAPSASFGGVALNYQVLASKVDIVQRRPKASDILYDAMHGWTLNVPANTTIQATATISIQAGQVVGPGAYTDALTLGVYNNASGVYRKSFETPFTASIGVKSLATLTVSGGKNYSLNFGDLKEGAASTVKLLVYSNQRFHLTVSSDNAGVMKPTDPAAQAEGVWRIPYTVSIFQTTPFSLAQRQTLSLWAEATQRTGLEIPVTVQIGSIAGQRAGIYRDVITIAIDPGA